MGFEQCFEGIGIVGDPDCMWESIPKFMCNTLYDHSPDGFQQPSKADSLLSCFACFAWAE